MSETTEIAVVPQKTNIEMVLNRLDDVHQLMSQAMVQNVDYGKIPGTGSKPTLLKPGAEKLLLMFHFSTKFQTVKTWHPDGHMTVESKCEVYGPDGNFLGDSCAIATTRESKWAWRKAERVCPQCGKPAIIKGKAEYGGGWVCFKKKDGCGAKFRDNDTQITSQEVGRVQNPDLPDTYNTVVRIAEKRAFIAAIRVVTGCSSIFDEEVPQAEHDHDDAPDNPEPRHTNGHAKEPVTPPAREFIENVTVQLIRERLVKLEVKEEQAVAWASKGQTQVLAELTPEQGNKLWEQYKPKPKKAAPPERDSGGTEPGDEDHDQ